MPFSSKIQINLNEPSTFKGLTLTRVQFQKRYEILTDLEETLDSRGEKLDSTSLKELSELVRLVIKEQGSILKKEKIEVDKDHYYYIEFRKDRTEKIKTRIAACLQLESMEDMLNMFKTSNWYRRIVVSHTSTASVDMLQTLRNSHEFSMGAIRIVKRLHALQLDALTGDVYDTLTRLFEQIFNLSEEQKGLNDAYNNEIFRALSFYRLVLDDPEKFIEILPKEETKINSSLISLGNGFRKKCDPIKTAIKDAQEKTSEELKRVADFTPYKVFITSILSTGQDSGRFVVSSANGMWASTNMQHYNRVWQYMETSLKKGKGAQEVEENCSNEAVWLIERADKKILDSVNYALASVAHSIQQIESNWNTRLNQLNQKIENHLLRKRDLKNHELFLKACLNKILFLHAICFQNSNISRQITVFLSAERNLLDQHIAQAGTGEKVFIRNTGSQQYLVCPEKEISDEELLSFKQRNFKRYKDSELVLTPSPESTDRSIWHIVRNGAEEEGMRIRNVVSKRFLVHPLNSRAPEIKVMGNPLIHIRNNFILRIAETYEGLWKLIKTDDVLREVKNKKEQVLS